MRGRKDDWMRGRKNDRMRDKGKTVVRTVVRLDAGAMVRLAK
jgi:hypothetical protein